MHAVTQGTYPSCVAHDAQPAGVNVQHIFHKDASVYTFTQLYDKYH
jgi:hypothetical protein